MQIGRIFLNEGAERVASFGQFVFLAQLRRRLKFRQTDIGRRRGRYVTALLVSHRNFLFEKKIITKKRSAAEHDQGEEQSKEPFHGWNEAIIRLQIVSQMIFSRAPRCDKQMIKRAVSSDWPIRGRERNDARGAPARVAPPCSR